MPAARQAGTRFCLENVPSYWGNVLGDRIADFEYIFSIVDDPVVGFTLDTGHAVLSGGCLNYIERLGSRLICSHLHSNDGATDGHLGYPEGVLDWEGTLRAMMASGFAAPTTSSSTTTAAGEPCETCCDGSQGNTSRSRTTPTTLHTREKDLRVEESASAGARSHCCRNSDHPAGSRSCNRTVCSIDATTLELEASPSSS